MNFLNAPKLQVKKCHDYFSDLIIGRHPDDKYITEETYFEEKKERYSL